MGIDNEINWDKVLKEIYDSVENRIAIGNGVRRAREEQGLSPSELSKILEIEESDLGLLETGKKPVDQNTFFIATIWFLEGMENAGKELTEMGKFASFLAKLIVSGDKEKITRFLEICSDLGKEDQEGG